MTKKAYLFILDDDDQQYEKISIGGNKGLWFFIIVLCLTAAGIPGVVNLYAGETGLIESGTVRLIMTIGFIAAIPALIIFMLLVRNRSKKFLLWLAERYKSSYPEIFRIIEEEGIGYKNKALEKLIGKAMKEEFARRYPGKEYDRDWYLNDVLFKEFKEYEKSAKGSEALSETGSRSNKEVVSSSTNEV
ncbi:MAG: hypothetical protein ACP6IY_21235 [Promethearchaeia archaeon]